jgi:hypothetical protein
VLKARSALATLDSVLRGPLDVPGPVAADLAAQTEEIRASAHEFVELRLLHLLRSERLPGRPEQLTELERLFGGGGADIGMRLGLPTDAPPRRLATAARETQARWQRVAEHPLTLREMRTAARAAARSCEGILATLAARATPDAPAAPAALAEWAAPETMGL